jgi:chromate transport protein ChrA
MASISIIVAICYELGKDTITDWRTIVIALLIVIVFKYKKINSAFVVGGALVGYLLMLYRKLVLFSNVYESVVIVKSQLSTILGGMN